MRVTKNNPGMVEIDRTLPAYRTLVTLRELILLFTPQEFRQIKAKTNTEDDIHQFWEAAQADKEIDLQDAIAIAGMGALVTKNVLTQERHDTIMLGLPN